MQSKGQELVENEIVTPRIDRGHCTHQQHFFSLRALSRLSRSCTRATKPQERVGFVRRLVYLTVNLLTGQRFYGRDFL